VQQQAQAAICAAGTITTATAAAVRYYHRFRQKTFRFLGKVHEILLFPAFRFPHHITVAFHSGVSRPVSGSADIEQLSQRVQIDTAVVCRRFLDAIRDVVILLLLVGRL
jgi:hypothetical protein